MNKINELDKQAGKYYSACLSNKNSFLKKPSGGRGKVATAQRKKTAESEDTIDLTDINDLSYSAIMRDIRKQCDKETVTEFLTLFKQCFDRLVEHEVKDPAQLALSLALKLFNSLHPLKLDIKKEAATSELGEASLVGRYLSDIIRFTLNRISAKSRPKALQTVLRKIYLLNETELAGKQLPASSSMGQAITFVKHVLFAHEPHYIREVINNIVRFLR